MGVFSIDGYMDRRKALLHWIIFFITANGTWAGPFATALFITDAFQPIWWCIACGVINAITTVWWIIESGKKPAKR